MQVLKPFRFSYINARSRAIKSNLISPYTFEELINAKSVADIVNQLRITDYGRYIEEDFFRGLRRYFERLYGVLTEPLNRYEKQVFHLFFFERKEILDKKKSLKDQIDIKIRELEREYVEKTVKAIGKLSLSEREDLKVILGSYFDMQNVITAVKFRIIFNLKPEEIFPFLIPFSYKISRKIIIRVLSAKTISEISDILLPVTNRDFSDYTQLRKVMYDYHIEQIGKVWTGFPFKISVPFAVLRLKEIEIMNLNTIYEGIKFNIDREEIKRMVVGL